MAQVCGGISRHYESSNYASIRIYLVSMASAVDLAKRALVSLLRALAIVYGISVEVSRDSDDAAVRRAFKSVCRKAHPDKGGSAAGFAESSVVVTSRI